MAPSPQLIERVKDSFSHMSFRQEAELQQNPLPVWTPPSPSVMPFLATYTSAPGPGVRLPYASQPLATVSLRTQLLNSRRQLSSTFLCPVMKGLSFTCKSPNRNVSLRSHSLFFLKAEGLKNPGLHPNCSPRLVEMMLALGCQSGSPAYPREWTQSAQASRGPVPSSQDDGTYFGSKTQNQSCLAAETSASVLPRGLPSHPG